MQEQGGHTAVKSSRHEGKAGRPTLLIFWHKLEQAVAQPSRLRRKEIVGQTWHGRNIQVTLNGGAISHLEALHTVIRIELDLLQASIVPADPHDTRPAKAMP